VSKVLFRKALSAACEWPSDVRLSFNLSPLEFASHAHAVDLISEIKASGMNPKRVVLELTENAMIRDTQHVAKILRLFRRHGIRIALDDFGSGFSSLNHLAQMPIDIVKIDRTFLDGLTEKRKNQAMLQGIVRLCHDMSLLTVLEGVETDLQRHSIRDAKVDFLQGYLFGRPQSRDRIRDLIARNQAAPSIAEKAAGA
jgi:EAL domain-containing protein (putative c-di-GMP-specific phosphodiesterase class I)